MRTSIAFLVVFVVACGARTPLDPGGGASGQPTASSADSGPPNGVAHFGYVLVGPGAWAMFYPQPVDPACAYAGAIGTCSVVTCFSDFASTPSDDAGSISVDVSSTGLGTVVPYYGMSPTGYYPYRGFPISADVGIGTTLNVIGSGGADVPMFDASVTIPDASMVTSPVANYDGMAIDTSQDLPVAWQPAPVGDEIFVIWAPLPEYAEARLMCFFDGKTGTGVVPRAALAAFNAQIVETTTLRQAAYTLGIAVRSETTVGDWRVNVLAFDGDLVDGVPITLD
jgi:hypothetical protein